MGHDPGLIALALEELEKQFQPSEMTAEKVTGKLMEIKGKLLQTGMTSTININLTYSQYLDRLKSNGVSLEPHQVEHATVMETPDRVKTLMGYKSTTSQALPRELDAEEKAILQMNKLPTETVSPPSPSAALKGKGKAPKGALPKSSPAKTKKEMEEQSKMMSADVMTIPSSDEEDKSMDRGVASGGR